MATRIEKWAEQAIRVVDGGGESTARIRLVSADGSTWQTWDSPFDSPKEWADEAEALCSELAQDFTGETACVFLAESMSGTVRAQLPRVIAGKRKAVTGGFGANPGAMPLHDMYAAQAKTAEKTLQSANVQLEVLTRTVEAQGKANAELLDYIRVAREHEALRARAETEDATQQQLMGQLVEHAPLILELLKSRRNKSVGEAVTGAVKQAAADVAKNGAAKVVDAVLTQGKQTQ